MTPKEMLTPVSLTPQELAFLRGLLKPYLEYYSVLAGLANCSAKHRAAGAEVRALVAKLNQEQDERAA